MRLVLLLLFYILSLCSYADDEIPVAKKKLRKASVFGVALPSRTPENGFYVQGGVIRVFKTDYSDSTLRASNLYLFGFYSQLNQFHFSFGGDLFTKEEKYYVYSWIYYSYTPELFFGIGRNTNPNTSEFINYRVFYSEIDVLRKIKNRLFGGINTRIETPYAVNYPKDGLFQSVYKGKNDFDVYGGGLRLRYDSRDNVLSSKKGLFVDLSFNAYNLGTNHQFKFSNYNVDIRKFIMLNAKKNVVFAMQAVAEFTDGNAPFRYLPNVITQAYHPNLYRDNDMIMIRNELRFRVYKFIGFSLFSGLALIAPSPHDIDVSQAKWNVGAGLRFMASKKYNLNMRIDYGVGDQSSNYYLSFTDTF